MRRRHTCPWRSSEVRQASSSSFQSKWFTGTYFGAHPIDETQPTPRKRKDACKRRESASAKFVCRPTETQERSQALLQSFDHAGQRGRHAPSSVRAKWLRTLRGGLGQCAGDCGRICEEAGASRPLNANALLKTHRAGGRPKTNLQCGSKQPSKSRWRNETCGPDQYSRLGVGQQR